MEFFIQYFNFFCIYQFFNTRGNVLCYLYSSRGRILTMDSFKSSNNRLVNFFKSSRDKWKQKAATRHKEIRALKIKVRDLQKSRDNWKNKSKEITVLDKKKEFRE